MNRITQPIVLIALATLIFSGPAGANTMADRMQRAMHASPMPNLMGMTLMNTKALQLNTTQQQRLNTWKESNHEKIGELINTIHKTEKNIHYAVLNDSSDAELQALKDELLTLRSQLMDAKQQCAKLLKSTLNGAQWAMLMQLRENKMRLAEAAKNEVNDVQAFLRASPMPKLMYIVIAHEAELQLDPEQTRNLADWRTEHMLKWSSIFNEVLALEKELTKNAMAMKEGAVLLDDFDQIAEKRRTLASMSVQCRDNLRKTLNDQQWKVLISLFKTYL